MANQMGSAAPPVQRRVKVTMIGYSEEAAPAGSFEVRVACYVTRSFEFWRRGAEKAEDAFQENHPAGSNTRAFPLTVAGLARLRSKAGCRDTLRLMLAALPQIRSLRLAKEEWDAVVPGIVVPEIVSTARRDSGFTFCLTMKLHVRVMHDEERALLMACKEWLASTAPGEKDCAICVNGLKRKPAVVLPGCPHAFHRRCISDWFSRARTCPICRSDVWKAALPLFIELSSTAGEPAQGTNGTTRD